MFLCSDACRCVKRECVISVEERRCQCVAGDVVDIQTHDSYETLQPGSSTKAPAPVSRRHSQVGLRREEQLSVILGVSLDSH